MWWKTFVILHSIVLQNIIYSQPVTDNENAWGPRQTKLDECCPCPTYKDGSNNFRDQDSLPTSRMSSFVRVPLNDYPCRFEGGDTEGSSSIFYPSVLRAVQPIERTHDSNLEPKLLLRPEVGLASSVLETLREATDEEYQEALARDAARSAQKTVESELLDSDPGKTRNSVTIVFNPRDDSSTGDDTIPEASHTQETRCIHNPLESTHFVGPRRMTPPRLSKEYIILPKRKPTKILHKSMVDMDNSPSNIQEKIHVNNKYSLSSKLKMNPLLLNQFETKAEQQNADVFNTGENSETEPRTMLPDNCNNFKRDRELTINPLTRLASFKSRLRDFTEKINENRLNNIDSSLKNNKLYNLGQEFNNFTTEVVPFNDNTRYSILFKKAPLPVKDILTLKDVELLPPRKNTKIHQLAKDNMKHTDLNVAGTENKDGVLMVAKSNIGDTGENSRINPKGSVPKMDEVILNSSEIQSITCEVPNETEMRNSGNSDSSINEKGSICEESQTYDNSISTEKDFNDEISENNSKIYEEIKDQSPDYLGDNSNEMKDLTPETSNNIMDQISDEDINMQSLDEDINDSTNNENSCREAKLLINKDKPNDLLKYKEENNGTVSPYDPLRLKSNSLTSFKDDILKRLENLKQTIRSNLQDTENTLEIPKPDSNNRNAYVSTNSQKKSGSQVSVQDLQKLSDSLLKQENSLRYKALSSQETECNNLAYDSNIDNTGISSDTLNDNVSYPEGLDYAETQLDEKALLPENISNFDYDATFSTSNPASQEEIDNTKNFKPSCDVFSSENSYAADKILSNDSTNRNEMSPQAQPQVQSVNTKNNIATNEMSSQASNSKCNAVRPHVNDFTLRSSLSENSIVQPSFSAEELNIFKKPLQIPSLEEIRQGITNILDEGQREAEESDTDTINESSNRNSVLTTNTNLRSKLPKSNRLQDIDIDLYQLRPFEKAPTKPSIGVPRLNINSFKTKLALPETPVLKPLKLESILGNREGMLGASLSLGSDKIKSKGKTESTLASEILGTSLYKMPTSDDIRNLLKTNSQNILKLPTIKIPRTNLLKRPSFSAQTNALKNDLKDHTDDAVKAIQTNLKEAKLDHMGLLSNARADSNDLLETMARKREDMKDKLQALHVDFNDRLASIHEKLADQTNLQSHNIPVYKESVGLGSPYRIGSDKDRDIKNLFPTRVYDTERNILSEPNLPLRNKLSGNKKIKPLRTPHAFDTTTSKTNDQLMLKQSIRTFTDTPLLELKKTSNIDRANKFKKLKNNIGKQSSFTPLKNSKVKISFSTTTIRPIIESKLQNKPTLDHPTKFPLEPLRKEYLTNLEPKGILQKYRSRSKYFGDLHHSPSELISATIPTLEKPSYEYEALKNYEDLNTPLKNTVDRNYGEYKLKNTNPDTQLRITKKPPKSIQVSSQALESLPSSIIPKAKENNSLISNIRESIRARLSNTKPPPNTLPTEVTVTSTIDTVHPPQDNVDDFGLGNNLLKENTSYKCSMVCVKDS